MQDFVISDFFGINTAVKDIKTLRPGTSPDASNWLTGKYGDHIELRRGTARLGTTVINGNGKITGLGKGVRYDGVEIPFFSYGRKVKYYDATTDDTIEVGTDLLPTDADGEDVWFRPYQNLAGSFVYFGSPNSGIYKIPAGNPGSAVDQSVNNFRFNVFHIGQNRAFAGQRNGTVAGNKDDTGLYLSYIDKALLSDYTQVTSEAVGSAGSTNYSGTLSDITGVRTAMYVSITDGTETFKDDRNGNMVGDQGGTGTINYATGAYDVTFNAITGGAVTADYYYEDSTSEGILDFSGSSNGQGKSFRQDDGGGRMMAIFNINTIEYCFHELKTWQFTATLDDTNSTNLPYRNVGIPYQRSAYQTPEGIIFTDVSRENDPKFRRMQVLQGTDITTIEPISISDALDLTPYAFDQNVAFRWGDYEIFAVQEKQLGTANDYNSVLWMRNVISGAWDRCDDVFASALEEYNGTLIAGDSISNNVYTLFSGFDEDGDIVPNYWTSSDLNLNTENLKLFNRLEIDGLIQPNQQVEVSLSFDGGAFATYFTIDGSGSYVDSGKEVFIGATTMGAQTIGGSGGSTASPFELDYGIYSDRFVHVRIRFEAVGIGFVQINSIKFKDIRNKGRKNTSVRTIN